LITGIVSGSAMLTYTVIKEANPPQYGGTATGVISLLNFGLSALVGPMLGGTVHSASAGTQPSLEHYQIAFHPLLYGVGLAIMLTLALKETGPAARIRLATAEAA
jgi:MFS family permease